VHKLPVGILGGTGYVGRELCALAATHPALRLVFATARDAGDHEVSVDRRALPLARPDDAAFGDAALIFSALPHGASAPWVERARRAGAKVVDLSADFRPGASDAPQASATRHASVPYGLTELARREVARAELVANPGCYATAVLLGLLPLLTRSLVRSDGTISVAAASGVTGAGHAPRADLLFGEVAEDMRPYAVDNTHRHLAEMRSVIGGLGCTADLIFTPHLLPVARGIIATITVPVVSEMATPLALWKEHYAGETFVEISDEPPRLRDVVRRNVARITAHRAAGVRRPTLVVLAAIDNLVKGAAGQALQNGNLLLGLDEALGLPA